MGSFVIGSFILIIGENPLFLSETKFWIHSFFGKQGPWRWRRIKYSCGCKVLARLLKMGERRWATTFETSLSLEVLQVATFCYIASCSDSLTWPLVRIAFYMPFGTCLVASLFFSNALYCLFEPSSSSFIFLLFLTRKSTPSLSCNPRVTRKQPSKLIFLAPRYNTSNFGSWNKQSF